LLILECDMTQLKFSVCSTQHQLTSMLSTASIRFRLNLMRQNNFRIFKERRRTFVRTQSHRCTASDAWVDLRNIRRDRLIKSWWSQSGSNRRPPACKAGALPAELWPLTFQLGLVGLGGFEPPTSPLSGVRSDQLSYRPGIIEFVCLIPP
jgi:hypothetical protein